MFTIDAHNVRNVTFKTLQYNSTNWTILNVETLDANNNTVVLRVNLFHPPGELMLDASAFSGVVILPPDVTELTPTPIPSANVFTLRDIQQIGSWTAYINYSDQEDVVVSQGNNYNELITKLGSYTTYTQNGDNTWIGIHGMGQKLLICESEIISTNTK